MNFIVKNLENEMYFIENHVQVFMVYVTGTVPDAVKLFISMLPVYKKKKLRRNESNRFNVGANF